MRTNEIQFFLNYWEKNEGNGLFNEEQTWGNELKKYREWVWFVWSWTHSLSDLSILLSFNSKLSLHSFVLTNYLFNQCSIYSQKYSNQWKSKPLRRNPRAYHWILGGFYFPLIQIFWEWMTFFRKEVVLTWTLSVFRLAGFYKNCRLQ